MPDRDRCTLHVHEGIAVWSGGVSAGACDIWFLHALGDSHRCFRDAYRHPIAEHTRMFLFDLPGHGASPPRRSGLSIDEAAQICVDLVLTFSAHRRVVLVGHSIAGIIATRAAQMLDCRPSLVISVEGNLTRADAFYSGQAANFEEPQRFYSAFQSRILQLAQRDDSVRRYFCSLHFADPHTLWTLGRSVLNCATPGEDFVSLACPHIYYWDDLSVTKSSKAFLVTHAVPQRKLAGAGHWPMVASPAMFYSAVLEDVLADASKPAGDPLGNACAVCSPVCRWPHDRDGTLRSDLIHREPS